MPQVVSRPSWTFYCNTAMPEFSSNSAGSTNYRTATPSCVNQRGFTADCISPAWFEVERDGKRESVSAGIARPYQEYGWQLVDNFIRVVQGHETPLFTAEDVAPSISVIEQAYHLARQFQLPWYSSDPNLALLKEAEAARPRSSSSRLG